VRVDLAECLVTRVGRDQLMGVENVSGGPRGDQLFGANDGVNASRLRR